MNTELVRQSYAEQLATRLRSAIESGMWSAGGRVPTIRKLAKEYEVSVDTALAALRVLEEQNWIQRKPSGSAFVSLERGRANESGRSSAALPGLRHIGLLGSCSSDPVDGWGTRIIAATESALADNERFALTRVPSFKNDSHEGELRRMLRQVDALGDRLVGAVIYFNDPSNLVALSEKLDSMGLPWVSIYRPTEQTAHNFVSADNLAAGKAVGRCFILEDIERVVVLSPDLAPVVSWTQKVTGLLEAYLHHRRPIRGIEYLCCETQDEEDGYRAMRDYLAHHEPPQAIFGIGDLLSIGAMRACRERGLRIPEDVAVVGSTGLDMIRFTSPPMTVAAQPMEAIGRELARMLLRMIQTGERRLPGKQIPGRLILRESTTISEATRRILKNEGLLGEARDELSAPRPEGAMERL